MNGGQSNSTVNEPSKSHRNQTQQNLRLACVHVRVREPQRHTHPYISPHTPPPPCIRPSLKHTQLILEISTTKPTINITDCRHRQQCVLRGAPGERRVLRRTAIPEGPRADQHRVGRVRRQRCAGLHPHRVRSRDRRAQYQSGQADVSVKLLPITGQASDPPVLCFALQPGEDDLGHVHGRTGPTGDGAFHQGEAAV